MEKIVIGVDSHELSVTIEVVDHRETLLGSGRFSIDKAGYAAMCRYVAAWPQRTWAVKGSNGAGRSLAQRLLADGEHVVDVPAKLASRARMLETGHGRKTDAHDAHSVADRTNRRGLVRSPLVKSQVGRRSDRGRWLAAVLRSARARRRMPWRRCASRRRAWRRYWKGGVRRSSR